MDVTSGMFCFIHIDLCLIDNFLLIFFIFSLDICFS